MSKNQPKPQAAATAGADQTAADAQAQAQALAAEQAAQAKQAAAGYLVAWHVKTGGKRYEPGDTITEIDDEAAAVFLKSGAIVAKA